MKKNIVAITSAPHSETQTFLSAKAIADYAKEQNWQVKVEMHGNHKDDHDDPHIMPLSPTDIEQADVVIVATDHDIDLSKFKGKPVYRTSTLATIKHTAQECMHAFEKAEIYTGERNNDLVKEAIEETHMGKCAVKKGAHRISLSIIIILIVLLIIYAFL